MLQGDHYCYTSHGYVAGRRSSTCRSRTSTSCPTDPSPASWLPAPSRSYRTTEHLATCVHFFFLIIKLHLKNRVFRILYRVRRSVAVRVAYCVCVCLVWSGSRLKLHDAKNEIGTLRTKSEREVKTLRSTHPSFAS